jgi:hypothetical protein
VTEECTESFNYRQLNATFIKLAIHLGFIGFLAYWTFVLVGPFIPIIVWSVVLTVALYPVFDWLAAAPPHRGPPALGQASAASDLPFRRRTARTFGAA